MLRNRESGHSLLYTILFIPITVGLGALAFDISSQSSLVDTLQSQIDSIALEAAQALPDRERAQQLASEMIDKLDLPDKETSIIVDRTLSSLQIILEGRPKSFLLPVLMAMSGQERYEAKIKASATAELVPVDGVVILSDGVDMRPWRDLSGSYESAWGNSDVWRESSAFSSCLLPPIGRYKNREAKTLWSSSEGKRWLTQSCFNPVFSAFKIAAMNLAELIGGVGSNRVSVIFTPGSPNNSGAEAIRHIQEETFLSDKILFAGSVGGFVAPGEKLRSSWTAQRDLEYELGDEACAVFSDTQTAPLEEYSIDALRTPVSGNQISCPSMINLPSCGVPHAIDLPMRVAVECLDESSLSEAIYLRAAKRPEGVSNAQPDLRAALGKAAEELLQSGEPELFSIEKQVRGNLATNPERIIILLTDMVPEVASIADLLNLFENAKISVIVGFVNRSNYSSAAVNQEINSNNALALQKYFLGKQRGSRIFSQVIIANSPEEIPSSIVKVVGGFLKRVVLKT